MTENLIIFCDMDAVLGPMFAKTVINPSFEKVQSIHELRETFDRKGRHLLNDVEIINKRSCNVIMTCWSEERCLALLEFFPEARIYTLGYRLLNPLTFSLSNDDDYSSCQKEQKGGGYESDIQD